MIMDSIDGIIANIGRIGIQMKLLLAEEVEYEEIIEPQNRLHNENFKQMAERLQEKSTR